MIGGHIACGSGKKARKSVDNRSAGVFHGGRFDNVKLRIGFTQNFPIAHIAVIRTVNLAYGFFLNSYALHGLNRNNRGHTYEESENAIRRTAGRGIYTGAHLILGLPGESRDEILHHADRLSELPVTTLKLHQLQLIRNTRMAKEYAEHPEEFHLYTADEYIDLVIDFIEKLNPSIVVERFVSQSPKELLIAPDWGLKNFEFTAKVNKRIAERNARQGRLFIPFS